MGGSEDKSPVDEQKRAFLKDLGLVAFGGAAAKWLPESLGVLSGVVETYEKSVDYNFTSPSERKKLFEEVFGPLDEFVLTEGAAHRTGVQNGEDNTITRVALENHLSKDKLSTVTIDELRENVPKRVDADFLAIGSWRSTPLSQWQSGYGGYSRAKQAKTIDDAIRWKIGERRTTEISRFLAPGSVDPPVASVGRLMDGLPFSKYDGSRVRYASSTLPVVDEESEKHVYPVAESGSSLIEKDLLIISRLPNLLSDRAFERNRKFVQFAGVFGPGTRGVLKLMDDEQLFGRLRDKVVAGNESYFQAVFEVAIRHDRSEKRTVVERVRPVVESREIELDTWFQPLDF